MSAHLNCSEFAARGLDSLRGLIRLALPVIYGTREVIPHLAEFLAAHPQLRMEMTVSDERQDLVAEGADVAIRLGKLEDSVFGARKVATLERLVVASPAYLRARGTPRTPADLAAHHCIVGPGSFGRGTWTFKRLRLAPVWRAMVSASGNACSSNVEPSSGVRIDCTVRWPLSGRTIASRY